MAIHILENTVVIPVEKRGKALRLLKEAGLTNEKRLQPALSSLGFSTRENEFDNLEIESIDSSFKNEFLKNVLNTIAPCVKTGSVLRVLVETEYSSDKVVDGSFFKCEFANEKMTTQDNNFVAEPSIGIAVRQAIAEWAHFHFNIDCSNDSFSSFEKLEEELIKEIKNGSITELYLDYLAEDIEEEINLNHK